MELTKQQILIVENYLDHKNFDFIDLRVEVLDHMISDIESCMQNAISFDDAFAMTKIRWEKHFRESSSFLFGVMYGAPKIVIQKAKQIFRKFYITIILLYFTILLFFDFVLQTSSIDNKIFSYSVNFVTMLCVVVFMYILCKRKREKTTYSFILKTQSLALLMGCIICAITFRGFTALDAIELGLFAVFAFSTYVQCYFYKKHKEAIKTYKIL